MRLKLGWGLISGNTASFAFQRGHEMTTILRRSMALKSAVRSGKVFQSLRGVKLLNALKYGRYYAEFSGCLQIDPDSC
jgi:hypothetical protein